MTDSTNPEDCGKNGQSETALDKQITKQIEYYFGDFNLPKDKFLQEQIKLDEGWIPISVLLTFNRLAKLSKDAAVIVAALERCSTGLIEISENREKLRRSKAQPVPEMNDDRKKELMTRTAYAKGFPLEEKIEQITEFMEQFGQLDGVIMRNFQDKAENKFKFKGSIFATFKSVDDCKSFIEKEEIKYKEKDLLRKWQGVYIEEKKKEIEERKNERKNKKGKTEAEKPEEIKVSLPKGCILHLKGLKEDISREQIKESIEQSGTVEVAFIQYNKGDKEAHVRLHKENAGVEFMKTVEDNKFKVGETSLDVSLLEGDEESQFLEKNENAIAQMRQNAKRGKGRKRRGSGRGGGRPKSKKISRD